MFFASLQNQQYVTNFNVGDRVVSHSNLTCRVCKAYTSGREFDCTRRQVWGFQTGSLRRAHSEGVSYEDADAASITILTSWYMLVGRTNITLGQTVLIMGGGSGFGSYATQIAKLYNCDVIATASPDKLDKCKELGVVMQLIIEKTIGGKIFKISKEIAKTKDEAPRIDLSFDHIGQTHFNEQLTLLKYGATLVSCGATAGYDAQIDLRHIFFKGTNILGSIQGTKAELDQGLYWMGRGKIKSIVDSVYTFEQAAETHTKILKGDFFGKIIIKPE